MLWGGRCIWLWNLVRAPSTTLFPYTTLFRSATGDASVFRLHAAQSKVMGSGVSAPAHTVAASRAHAGALSPATSVPRASRSEEHTSELQSHVNLVCRLLLENKNRIDVKISCP